MLLCAAIVGPRLRFPDIEKLDRTTLLIHVPQFYDYQITFAETLRLTLPNDAMASRTSFIATPDLVIYPFSGSASLDGTLSGGTTEAAIRTQSHVLRISLIGNRFLSALSNMTDPARHSISADVLRGCASNAGDPTGWNAQLLQLTASDHTTRLSDYELEVQVPAIPAYQTSTPETIVVTLPASALIAQQPLVAGTFTVLADAGSAELSGTLFSANAEATVRSSHSELVITLTGDTWVPSLSTDGGLALELIAGLSGDGGDSTLGWDATVRPFLTAANMRLESARQLVLSVPQLL